MNDKRYHCVLTIAGSDSSGGAGIQADIKTISATGCYAASIITALTAQNTQGVKSIFNVPSQFVADQWDAIFDDITIDAIKVGMLHQVDIINLLLEKISQFKVKVVLDPVMHAKDGSQLLLPSAITALTRLFPFTYLVTPNIVEAEALAGLAIRSCEEMEKAAIFLSQKYQAHFLIKGGHLKSDLCVDVLHLYDEKITHWYESERVPTIHTHGTGCTFSAAIASYIAQGNDLVGAIMKAKSYLTRAIAAAQGRQLGKGRNPVHHFFNWE